MLRIILSLEWNQSRSNRLYQKPIDAADLPLTAPRLISLHTDFPSKVAGL